jgi:hypothetical protein
MNIKTLDTTAAVDVLIAYDDVAAGKHAKELCDRLLRRLGPGYEMRITPWSLAALELPSLAAMAPGDALRPELLIIAVNGEQPLAAAARKWIRRWALRTRAAGGAVVAQLHSILRMGQELAPAYGELQRIVGNFRPGFFPTVAEPVDRELERRIIEIHRSAHMRTALQEIGRLEMEPAL